MHNIKFRGRMLRDNLKAQNKKKIPKIAGARKEAVDVRSFLLGIVCQEMHILLLHFAPSCYLLYRTTSCDLYVTLSQGETHAVLAAKCPEEGTDGEQGFLQKPEAKQIKTTLSSS